MRVAMLNLTAGRLSGGYRKYLQHVVPPLRAERAISELVVVVPPGHEQYSGVGNDAWTWRDGEHLLGYRSLRQRVRAWKPDVVFIPTARYINCHAPTLCMVQNMLPMMPPTLRDGVAAWGKLRADAALARYAVTRATRVIAVSDYVRGWLIDEWHIPAKRIGVVYHGVDPVDTTPAFHGAHIEVLPRGKFLFAAGSLFPYRGLEDAVQALPLLRDTSVQLVIAGEGSAGYRNQISELARHLHVAGRVVWIGQVDPAVMTAAYQRCAAFLMTSRVEACPNIALEAMAAGARCISTLSPPMPEFFTESALYYGAGDASTLAEHINTVLSAGEPATTQAQSAARARAAAFLWRDTKTGVVEQLEATARIP